VAGGRPKGPIKFDPEKHCGVVKSKRPPCKQPKGYRTDHLGEGACYLHGGKSGVIKTGLHSKYMKPLDSLIAECAAKSDMELLDLRPKLAVIEALYTALVGRYDQDRRLLELFAETVSPEFEAILTGTTEQVGTAVTKLRQKYAQGGVTRPNVMLDVTGIVQLVEVFGRMVERIKRIENRNSIAKRSVERMMRQVAEVVMEATKDHPEVRTEILKGWARITYYI